MHVHFLDPYQHRSSPIHTLDARVKLFLTVVLILSLALMPVGAWPVYILCFSLVLVVILFSDLGVGYVLKRSLLALPFVLAALPLLFTIRGASLFSLRFFGLELIITLPGLERFLSIAFKSWLSLQAAIVLASSTPFPELLKAMRALRVPRLLVAVFGLMWRYLFVLADEAMRLMRARASRSGESNLAKNRMGGSIAWRARVTGGMAGNLFLRGFERSDRIYMAMLSRGYDGEVRTFSSQRIGKSSWLVMILGLCAIALLFVLAVLI
jgi:cobalt/nickel transport system permease protein